MLADFTRVVEWQAELNAIAFKFRRKVYKIRKGTDDWPCFVSVLLLLCSSHSLNYISIHFFVNLCYKNLVNGACIPLLCQLSRGYDDFLHN